MRHHYVPQFLLSAWAEGNTDGKFVEFRLQLPDVPTRRRGKKETAFKYDLLALSEPEVGGISQQAIETKLMQRVDTDAALVRTQLIEQGASGLSVSDRCDWARFLISLNLRQPQFVEKNIRAKGTADLLQVLESDPEQNQWLAGLDDPPTLVEWVRKNQPGLIEDFGLTVVPGVIDNRVGGEKLINLGWIVRDLSPAKNELILGDKPLISIGKLDAPSFALVLPMSPTKLFVACRANGTIRAIESARPDVLVARANESSIEGASRWVYARTEAPGRFIRNRAAILNRIRVPRDGSSEQVRG